MLTKSIMALPLSMEKVKGNVRAISIAPVKPGTAPTVTPRVVPSSMRNSPFILKSIENADSSPAEAKILVMVNPHVQCW